MAKKWVLEKNNLAIGHVIIHRQLVKTDDEDEVLGGGYWHLDDVQQYLYLYGTSDDFGSVTQQQLEQYIKTHRPPINPQAIKVLFSQSLQLDQALADAVVVMGED